MLDPRVVERIDAIKTYLALIGMNTYINIKNDKEYSFALDYLWGRIVIKYKMGGLEVVIMHLQFWEDRDYNKQSYIYNEQEEMLELVMNKIVDEYHTPSAL